MKFCFTLVILFFCLKLSAVNHPVDSLKRAKRALKTASAPLAKDSLRIKIPQNRSDSTIKAPISTADDSLNKQTAVVINKDGMLTVVMMDADKAGETTVIPKRDWSYTLPSVTYIAPNTAGVKNENTDPPAPPDINPPVTSLIQLDSLREAAVMEQIKQDNLRKLILKNEQIKLAQVLKINNLDSLKLQLKTATSDTVKALLYTRIALKYMDNDTLADAIKQAHYRNSAINYTLLAIHEYSTFDDSIGLRDSYTNLSKVYYSQGKHTEAKWFILQAIALSRAKNDVPNVISGLMMLAAIKSDIKDYTLAMGDLDEARQLAISSHAPKTEAEVLKSYAYLYSNLQNYPKEELVLKQRDSILDSIQKAEQAELAKAATLKKKQDALAKKKQYLASLKKPSKNTSQAKTASL